MHSNFPRDDKHLPVKFPLPIGKLHVAQNCLPLQAVSGGPVSGVLLRLWGRGGRVGGRVGVCDLLRLLVAGDGTGPGVGAGVAPINFLIHSPRNVICFCMWGIFLSSLCMCGHMRCIFFICISKRATRPSSGGLVGGAVVSGGGASVGAFVGSFVGLDALRRLRLPRPLRRRVGRAG